MLGEAQRLSVHGPVGSRRGNRWLYNAAAAAWQVPIKRSGANAEPPRDFVHSDFRGKPPVTAALRWGAEVWRR